MSSNPYLRGLAVMFVMKKFALLTVGVVCCFATVFSQSYFYDRERPIPVEKDLTTIVLHFQDEASFDAFTSKNHSSFQLIREIAKYHMAVIEASGNTNPDFSVSDFPEFANSGIKDESFALQLEDGFKLWLGYEILFEPKPNADIHNSELARDLFFYDAKITTDRFGLNRIEVSDPEASLEIANKLVESGLVNWAHPNFYANHTKFSDPLYPAQFQMNNTGQSISGTTGQDDIDCDAPEAWEITTGSADIEVAVIDDGVEDHPDLEDGNGNSRVLTGLTPAINGNGAPIANAAHGMACSGIIGATHNSIGVKGLAPNVKIRPVNIFEGTETVADLANAFTWVKDEGADVISNSWGYLSCTLSLSALNSAISSARLNGRDGDGCVIVFAAGNSYGSCVEYPANLSYVLAVGAVTSTGAHANYSNTGSDLDIVAPSGPAPGQPGAGVRTIDREGPPGYSFGDYTNNFGGTSAACPLVSGAAALLLSFDPSLTETQVRNFLEDSATDMGPTGFDNTYGHGRVNAHQALLVAGGGELECENTIASFPYSEGFENGIGLFSQSQNDDFDWSTNSGSTDTDGTGPDDAFEGDAYLYIESSGPNYPNKTATISTPCFDLSNLADPTVYFEYHMYGSSIGDLTLQARSDDESWTTIWSRTGEQGSQWLSAEVDLSSFSESAPVKLRFVGSTSTSFTGDIAIDNFSIGEFEEQTTLSCDVTLTDLPYLMPFEAGFQNWVQGQEDDFNWSIGSGATPTYLTGPENAVNGSNYMYIETSAPNYPNKTADLISPCFDLSGLESPALYFYYHMFGGIGSLKVDARDSNGDWITLWSLSGNQGNSWFLAEVSLADYIDNPGFKLRITGTSANLFNGDIAIDEIEITEAGQGTADAFCSNAVSEFPYLESFESGLGSWIQSDVDDFDWTVSSGSTPTFGTGPTAALEGLSYAFAESSAPNYPNKSARMVSPCFDISALSEPAFSFGYHMFGASMGNLKLEVRTENLPWTELWSASGSQGNSWNLELINLADYTGSDDIKFRFAGTTAMGFTSDFALDLIKIDEFSELQNDTGCNEPISVFPHTESFESGFGTWVQSANDNTDWALNNGATLTYNTGPASASHGESYIYLESSYPHYPSKTAIIESPCLNLSNLSSTEIVFDYHMYGATMGTLSLEVLNENQEWETIWTESGNQNNLWETAVVVLGPFGNSETVSLRFVGTTGNGFLSDIAIDHIRFGSEVAESESASCPPVNFNSIRIGSYGVNQDAGTYSITDNGSALTVENNAWKAAEFNYEVTTETILELEFKSLSEGEIHGIGFDNDMNISADQTFQFHGTQSWGILNYNTYSGSNWVSYTIPVGDFFTGSFTKLVFISDNDAGNTDDSMFRNVKVYESGDCDNLQRLTEAPPTTPVYGTEAELTEELSMSLYPNPAHDRINAKIDGFPSKSLSLHLIDITGTVHQSKRVMRDTETFELHALSSGIYLIQLREGDQVIAIQRFVKTR